MKTYMFDTNVFNYILDGKVDVVQLIGKARFFATHVQLDEIKNTRNLERREQLLKVFEDVMDTKVATESLVLGVSRLGEAKLSGEPIVPTESAVWDISKWNQAKWSSEDGYYEPLKRRLDQLNGSKFNNIHDALIAETSIKNGFTLVTHDNDLFKVVTQFGGACANFQQVIKELLQIDK